MANIIKIKRSAVTGNIPTIAQLQLGELALNTTDGRLFLKRSVSAVESIVQVGKDIIYAPAFSATLALDCSLGTIFDLALTGNTTITFANGIDGMKILLRVKQDATGSRLITFGAGIRFGTDVPSVTLTATASKTDYIGLIYNGLSATYDVLSFSRGF